MIGTAPQKGKAFEKLPSKTLASFEATKYLVSIKFDGNQVFIHKEQDNIRMYTSDWKEFHIRAISQELLSVPGNFLIVGEYLHGCEGKLGDRTKSAVLTTFRTNHSKGIINSSTEEAKAIVKVFDFIEITSMHVSGILYTNFSFDEVAHSRILNARRKLKGLSHLSVVDTVELSGKDATAYAKRLVRLGWEGAMLIEPNTPYHHGKRVNHVIKLKYRRTADLLCVGFEDGKDGFEGMIGALILKDSKGRLVSVGTGGGSHAWRNNDNKVKYLGAVIEIEYEQIMATYIQPSLPEDFLRSDKSPGEID
jgi:ATP-dependent DNA ligase